MPKDMSEEDYDELDRLLSEEEKQVKKAASKKKQEQDKTEDKLNLLVYHTPGTHVAFYISLFIDMFRYDFVQAEQCATLLIFRNSFVVKTVNESKHNYLRLLKVGLKKYNIKSTILPGNVWY